MSLRIILTTISFRPATFDTISELSVSECYQVLLLELLSLDAEAGPGKLRGGWLDSMIRGWE